MRTARPRNSVKIVSTILICVMSLLAIALIIQFVSIISLKNKEKKLLSTYQHTQEQIVEYDELLDYINYSEGEYSQEFLESYAREYLSWGKTDRTYYQSN